MSKFEKALGWFVVVAILLGFILPQLISSRSDDGVFLGLSIIAVGVVIIVRKLFKEKS